MIFIYKLYIMANVNGIIVYRGMDRNHISNNNVWVTDSSEYAEYFAKQEYNNDGIVKSYILPQNVIDNLCYEDDFEAIMNENELWQEIPEDSDIWLNGDDEEDIGDYDLQHDLCYPTDEQINVIKSEGYEGIAFEYEEGVYSIMVFDARNLIKNNTNENKVNMKKKDTDETVQESIKISESDIRKMVTESVKKVLKEGEEGRFMIYEFDVETLERNSSNTGYSTVAKKAQSSNEALLSIVNDAIKNGFTINEISFRGQREDYRQNGYRKEVGY